MAGRIRAAIAIVTVLCCISGCVTWQRVGTASSRELSREIRASEPVDELRVTEAVGPDAQLLLEIRRLCKATAITTVERGETERANINKLPVYVGVLGFLIGVVGGSTGVVLDNNGAAISFGIAGAVLTAPFVYGLAKRGDVRTRTRNATESSAVTVACETGGFETGATATVTTPWGQTLSGDLSEDGLVVVRASWSASQLEAAGTWTVEVAGVTGTWQLSDETRELLVSRSPKKQERPQPAPKKKRPRSKKKRRR
jgi:hypothetical protein